MHLGDKTLKEIQGNTFKLAWQLLWRKRRCCEWAGKHRGISGRPATFYFLTMVMATQWSLHMWKLYFCHDFLHLL